MQVQFAVITHASLASVNSTLHFFLLETRCCNRCGSVKRFHHLLRLLLILLLLESQTLIRWFTPSREFDFPLFHRCTTSRASAVAIGGMRRRHRSPFFSKRTRALVINFTLVAFIAVVWVLLAIFVLALYFLNCWAMHRWNLVKLALIPS